MSAESAPDLRQAQELDSTVTIQDISVAAPQVTSLWHHSNFLKLWLSETISQFGSQFTALAFPFTAIIFLNAGSADLGLLAFLGTLPWLLFGLIIGVWVDRHRKRRIMVSSNLLRGSLLATIPAMALTGQLTRLGLPFLYGLSFMIGVLQIFFDVSYQSYLPSLVERKQLVEGNSKLEASRASAQAVGPTVAGIIIRIVTAPMAIIFDAVSFFGSALSLGRIRKEELVNPPETRPSVRSDIREGLGVVLGDTRLRSIAGSTGTSNFFSSAFFTILPLYLANPGPDGLGLGKDLAPIILGLVFSVGSVGALVGVFLAGRAAKRLGVGIAITAGIAVSGLGGLPFYFAGPLTSGMPLMMLGMSLILFGSVVYNINQVSLRQAIVPIRLQGRMNASMRFLVWGTIPIGGLVGGLLGEFLGLRTTIGITAIAGTLAFLWVLLSPVRPLKKIPEPLA